MVESPPRTIFISFLPPSIYYQISNSFDKSAGFLAELKLYQKSLSFLLYKTLADENIEKSEQKLRKYELFRSNQQ